jgi:uncharacterized protein (DUF1810 family)
MPSGDGQMTDHRPSKDLYRLDRFLDAQDRRGAYDDALAELRAGHKTGHWMWFVFPQIAGLGMSEMSRKYAISSLAEAEAYLAHPVLGPRLRECTQAIVALQGRSASEIFGGIDSLKLRSSLTLFSRATPGDPLFSGALQKYFDGVPDPKTEQILASAPGRGA